MPIKSYKPTTPSRRHMTQSTFQEITTSTPEKSLLVSIKKTGGRNNTGMITCRHIGGGNKRKYRIIDFKRNKDGVVGKVATIEYDPNRNANICLINYTDGASYVTFSSVSTFVYTPNTSFPKKGFITSPVFSSAVIMSIIFSKR